MWPRSVRATHLEQARVLPGDELIHEPIGTLTHAITIRRLQTDNAFAYIHNRSLRALLQSRTIRHLRTRPYTPTTNGKVERYQQTLQREWAYALEYASSTARRQALTHWVRHYNERRTHSALGNHPPIERVREVTGLDS